jgi:SAM-dependent methyltransferase
MFVPKEILQNLLMGIPIVKKIAWKKHTTGINNDPEKAHLLWEQIKAVRTPENKTVLEIGPGRTDLLLYNAKKEGAESVHALDVYLYLDTKILESNGIGYNVYKGKSMPFKDGYFDLVWSNDTFEHIKHPEIMLNELYRVLKTDGIVIINIDLTDHYTKGNDESLLFNCLKYPEWLWRLMTSNRSAYVNRIRYTEWLNLLRKAGFHIIVGTMYESEKIKQLCIENRLPYLKNYSEEDAITYYATILVRKETVS